MDDVINFKFLRKNTHKKNYTQENTHTRKHTHKKTHTHTSSIPENNHVDEKILLLEVCPLKHMLYIYECACVCMCVFINRH